MPPDPLSLQNELSFSLSTEVQMKKSLLSLAILAAVCPAAAFAADSAEQIHTIVWSGSGTCKSSKDHSKPRNEVDTSLKSPV